MQGSTLYGMIGAVKRTMENLRKEQEDTYGNDDTDP